MTLVYATEVDASPETVWALVARPESWHLWAPHVRGAWGLGCPEVQSGATGAVRLLGLVPVPARVVAKEPDRSWSWRVGLVQIAHRVRPTPAGCSVQFELSAPAALELALRVSYGPLVRLIAGNLARVAAREEAA